MSKIKNKDKSRHSLYSNSAFVFGEINGTSYECRSYILI